MEIDLERCENKLRLPNEYSTHSSLTLRWAYPWPVCKAAWITMSTYRSSPSLCPDHQHRVSHSFSPPESSCRAAPQYNSLKDEVLVNEGAHQSLWPRSKQELPVIYLCIHMLNITWQSIWLYSFNIAICFHFCSLVLVLIIYYLQVQHHYDPLSETAAQTLSVDLLYLCLNMWYKTYNTTTGNWFCSSPPRESHLKL